MSESGYDYKAWLESSIVGEERPGRRANERAHLKVVDPDLYVIPMIPMRLKRFSLQLKTQKLPILSYYGSDLLVSTYNGQYCYCRI